MSLKFGVSAKFHKKIPTFFGERAGHIQYLESTIAAWLGSQGVMPLMIPSASATTGIHQSSLDPTLFAKELDALILQGGSDIHPRFYQEEPQNYGYEFDEERDLYELQLIEAFIKEGKPILGICRGFQLLNIYFGGSLHQDLETANFKQHLDKAKSREHTHLVTLQKEGLLSQIYGKELQENVVSIHHQGIKKLGENLKIEALSSHDNLIEAFSYTGSNFVVGVQWHPEFHNLGMDQHLDGAPLFKTLVQAAKQRKFFGKISLNKKKRLHFGESQAFTLGGEIELQIVDDTKWDLNPICPEILAELDSSKTKEEIFQSMIELESAVCQNALQVEKDWNKELLQLLPVVKKYHSRVVGGGTHPFAKISERRLTDGKRYANLMNRNQWVARRIAIFGLHCHVGMNSKEEAIKYYRFYLSVAPLLLGLSASSPYLESENTGLASIRSTFFESTPAGGHPPILNNWQEFEGLYYKMIKSGAIESHKDLWWDVRPSIDYGTLEIRICDVLPTLEENAALIALIHMLALAYADQENFDFRWPDLAEWSYRENKWRATRYGLDFNFIIADSAETIPAKDYLLKLFEQLEALAQELGYERYLHILHGILNKGTASQRIQEWISAGSSQQEVVAKLSEELEVRSQEFFKSEL
ncbi:MAG: YbdK family carboxylate-amine ligase [Bdellovibrionia bacterium]